MQVSLSDKSPILYHILQKKYWKISFFVLFSHLAKMTGLLYNASVICGSGESLCKYANEQQYHGKGVRKEDVGEVG